MTTTICIDAPVATVWKVLSDLPAIHLWVPAIRRSHCPTQSRGVGALRVCELGQATIRETIVEWDEGRAFTYEGVGAPMMKHASNRWSVAAHGERQTLVTSYAEVELKGWRRSSISSSTASRTPAIRARSRSGRSPAERALEGAA